MDIPFAANPFIAGAFGLYGLRVLLDAWMTRRARDRLLAAEEKAFGVPAPPAIQDGPTAPEQIAATGVRGNTVVHLEPRVSSTLKAGALFDLYSKQIEKYQTETQSRAGWSFTFALLAMLAGLGFVIWGGSVVFAGGGWQQVTAGSAISSIGGVLSAFITKTFLDVHRMSLLQLNRYFRQPVINAHILMAQQLADQLDDAPAKRDAYNRIISRVIDLIRDDAEPVAIPPEDADEEALVRKAS